MAKPDPISVEAIFIEAMKGRGFKRKALNWYHDGGDVVAATNLQTSNWNDRKHWGVHYLNVGCYIRELDERRRYPVGKLPPGYCCQVRFRLSDDSDPSGNRITCLDDDSRMAQDERLARIHNLIEKQVVPWMRRFSSRERLIEAWHSRQLPEHIYNNSVTSPWFLEQIKTAQSEQ